MSALVIAQRYVPVEQHPDMELRLAVDPDAATLNVVAIVGERVALIDFLSETICRRRKVVPPTPEALQGDPRRLLTSIPDSDYARLVSDDSEDVLERIVRIKVSEPPSAYFLVQSAQTKAPNPKAPPLDSVRITIEQRAPDEPDQPCSTRSARHSEGIIRLAAHELHALRKREKRRGGRLDDEAMMRLALRALKRAGDMFDSVYSTIYLGDEP